MTSSQLSLIAASGHEPPSVHLALVGLLLVGVVVLLLAGARRRRNIPGEPGGRGPSDVPERKRSEP